MSADKLAASVEIDALTVTAVEGRCYDSGGDRIDPLARRRAPRAAWWPARIGSPPKPASPPSAPAVTLSTRRLPRPRRSPSEPLAFFSLDAAHPNCLAPRKRPGHTLIPSMYVVGGRPLLAYGTMGGEGQPQTQAALVTRLIDRGLGPQAAVEAPRCLFGRTWGEASRALRLEPRFEPAVVESPRRANGGGVERCHGARPGDPAGRRLAHRGIGSAGRRRSPRMVSR